MTKLITFARVHFLLLLALIIWVTPALTLQAATIYVDSGCDLDDALDAANGDEEEDDCEVGDGSDTIVLTEDIEIWKELETITSRITIEGNGKEIEVKFDDEIFDIEGGRLTIRNLRVEWDRTRRSEIIEVDDGRLTIINSRFENCREGIEQEKGHTTIIGNTDVCDLDRDDYVEGGTVSFEGGTTAGTGSSGGQTAASSCDSLGHGVVVKATLGNASGVQCTQLDATGVGNQSVTDMGLMNAVDVWSYVEQGVEICFPQQGRIVFLDAATSPRSIAHVDSYRLHGMTCAYLQRAGTVALVQGQTTEDRTPGATTTEAAATTAQPATPACSIQTTGHLRLRATPSLQAETLGYVYRGTTLSYSQRTAYWFKVTHQGLTGWIGARYVNVLSAC